MGDETKILLCDVCDKGAHTYCLDPPLSRPPTGKISLSLLYTFKDVGYAKTVFIA